MTQPPGPLCALFRRHLRDVGLKYTPERAKTLDAAFHIGRAFEVDELMHELSLRGGGASKATVYRTVRLMVDAGVLEQILIDRDRAHYRISTEMEAPLLLILNPEQASGDDPQPVGICRDIATKSGWSYQQPNHGQFAHARRTCLIKFHQAQMPHVGRVFLSATTGCGHFAVGLVRPFDNHFNTLA